MKLQHNNTLDLIYKRSINREDFVVKARDGKHSLQSIANFLKEEEKSEKTLSRQRIKQIEDDTRFRIKDGQDIAIRPSHKKSDYYDDYFMRKVKLTEKMKKVILFVERNKKKVEMKGKSAKMFFESESVSQHVIDGLINRSLINVKEDVLTLTNSGKRAVNCVLNGITGEKENQDKQQN